jgi:hypothetical protein
MGQRHRRRTGNRPDCHCSCTESTVSAEPPTARSTAPPMPQPRRWAAAVGSKLSSADASPDRRVRRYALGRCKLVLTTPGIGFLLDWLARHDRRRQFDCPRLIAVAYGGAHGRSYHRRLTAAARALKPRRSRHGPTKVALSQTCLALTGQPTGIGKAKSAGEMFGTRAQACVDPGPYVSPAASRRSKLRYVRRPNGHGAAKARRCRRRSRAGQQVARRASPLAGRCAANPEHACLQPSLRGNTASVCVARRCRCR